MKQFVDAIGYIHLQRTVDQIGIQRDPELVRHAKGSVKLWTVLNT